MRRIGTILVALLAAAVAPAVSALVPVTNVRYFVAQDYTRVVIDIGTKAEYTVGRVDSPGLIRIFFDLHEATLNKDLAERDLAVDAGLLKKIRIGQNDVRTVRVVLDFAEETRISSFMIANPYRLVIDVLGTGGAGPPQTPAPPAANTPPSPHTTTAPPPAQAPPVPVEPPAMNSNGTYSMARQLGLGVRLVVLDAGHGGADPGCISRSGLQEKLLTLDIVNRLKPMVEKELDCKVSLTRSDDRFVPLEERTAISNTLKADLFVSVHINSSPNRSTYGTETYFLNFATDQRAVEVAARENAMSSKNMGELQSLVQRIALNSKIDESHEFAAIMQRDLIGKMQKHNPNARGLGVKQAPFYVLIGAQMPAILVEANFISNAYDEKLLRNPAYRQHFAEAILSGLKDYVATLNRPSTASASSAR